MTNDTYAMTPLYPDRGEDELHDLILELRGEAGRLSASMHPATAEAVAALVVNMNSYYSNLIEGNFTHPLHIEKALKKEYAQDDKKRMLQLESETHVIVNKSMRDRLAAEPELNITSVDFLKWLHGEFYGYLPEAMHHVRGVDDHVWEIIPGHLRTHEVLVGGHIAPTWEALPAFMERFDTHYSPAVVHDPVRRILAIAASHHRLAWIHPFADGNGRITRLYSEAYLIREGLAANGLWSISRGLAFWKKEYYSCLNNADMKRANDYDGRGNLSERGLLDFCLFFLRTAIDQVQFMSSLFAIDTMLERIDAFCGLMAVRGEMRPEAGYLLREVFLRGRVAKGEIMHITGRSEAIARPVMNDLLSKGLLRSEDGLRGALMMSFPIAYVGYLFPNLYPPEIEATLG